MLTIELLRNSTARCGSTTITTSSKLDPVAPLCRKLIEQHHDPEQLARVMRDGVEVFAKAKTLRAWAEYDTVDTDRGLVRRKWRPFPGAECTTEVQAV